MFEQNLNIEKLLTELSKEIVSGIRVSDLFDNPKEFPTELIERLSLETALKYWTGQMTYQEADRVMNRIYAFWITNAYYKNYAFPDVACECFEAFDAGEYYRKDDDRTVDPAEIYTRPLVENLLRKRKRIA